MFDNEYPDLTAWILGGDTWIELGQDDFSESTIRILDIGGLIWESEHTYTCVSAALADAEQALAAWIDLNGLQSYEKPR